MPLNNPFPTIEEFIRKIQWQDVPLNAGWTTTVTGSGAVNFNVRKLSVGSGATADSTALVRTLSYNLLGINLGFYIDWSKYTIIQCVCASKSSGTNGFSRLTLGKASGDGIGDLADKGIGFRVDNYALKGITHNGTTLTVVDLAITLIQDTAVAITIVSTGNGTVQWFVNGQSKGITYSGPSGISTWNKTVLQVETGNGADEASNYIVIGDLKIFINY